MGLPHATEARPFYRAAKQRFEDARFLLEAQRTTGAIYLAGYSVECMLKALILAMVPDGKRSEMLASFRGSKAHDYDWLKERYFENKGPSFPKAIAKAFTFVNTWAVEIRYKAGTSKYRDAKAFLASAEAIMAWADGRM
jgi:HEPN domain-containing protein